MIKWLIILIILILILSYFGINIQQVVSSPTGQSNISYVWGGIVSFWNTYLAAPVDAVWNDIWNSIGQSLWNAFMQGISNIKVNQNTPNLDTVSPKASN